MAKIMTLSGVDGPVERCKCVWNKKTKRATKLCFVGKTKKNKSGWQFTSGSCTPHRK